MSSKNPDAFADFAANDRRNTSRSHKLTASAQIYAFPPCRNQKLVAALLKKFQGLLKRHDREGAKLVFEQMQLSPIRGRLMRLGMNPSQIEEEIYALKVAIHDLGWQQHAEISGNGEISA